MKPETRYSYEKRLQVLEEEVDILRGYKALAFKLFDNLVDYQIQGKTVNHAWLIKQFKDIFR